MTHWVKKKKKEREKLAGCCSPLAAGERHLQHTYTGFLQPDVLVLRYSSLPSQPLNDRGRFVGGYWRLIAGLSQTSALIDDQ